MKHMNSHDWERKTYLFCIFLPPAYCHCNYPVIFFSVIVMFFTMDW